MTKRGLVFCILLAVTGAIYGTMLLWSLPAISAAAGGLRPFDLRPAGYNFAEAHSFLAALSEGGRDFYLGMQHRLDSVYPALLAATIGFALCLLAPAPWGRSRWALVLLAVPGAVFDYLENRAVAAMLRAGAEGLDEPLAATASQWTVLKSGFSALAMLALLALLGFRLMQWRRRRRS